MYKIIGSDQKEYGPVTADELRQWIAQGRVNARTQAQAEGSGDWKPLADFPELADAFRHRAPAPAPALPLPAAKTSGMAITSLVLGILSFASCGLLLIITSPLGLIFGLVSMNKIKKSQGQLGGRGLALAGTIVSAVSIVMIPFFAALLLPALAQAKKKAQTINCVNNMKQIALAVRIYATDNKDRFPGAGNWCDAILANAGTDRIFRCPAGISDGRSHYAFNAKLSGAEDGKIDPSTVMIFETEGGWNVSGGPELMLQPPRHNRVAVVAFADGSVQILTESRLSTLRWNP